jgi:restriction system protein
MWMIRNSGGENIDLFLDKGIAAVGWHDIGSLSGNVSRDDVVEKVEKAFPAYKPRKAFVTGGQLYRMAKVIKTDDSVITYDPATRNYHLGTVMGDYGFDQANDEGLAHFRPVKWQHVIERDKLSAAARNSLGSTLTIFLVPKFVEQELNNVAVGKMIMPISADVAGDSAVDEEATEEILLDDLKTRAKEFVKDKVMALDWDEMQELVAGVLRAMGYKTRVSPHGADRGRDILASPDGLGLEQPRIAVEVKHRQNTPMGSQEIRSFLGGRHKDDRGLYISTGGFSKDARYEADRASIPLTLMGIDDLVDLILDNYEDMDIDTRALIPLTRVYWPS